MRGEVRDRKGDTGRETRSEGEEEQRRGMKKRYKRRECRKEVEIWKAIKKKMQGKKGCKITKLQGD